MSGSARRGHILDLLFLVGLAFKAFDGLLELIGGVILLVVSPEGLSTIARQLTAGELLEDPHDMIANLIMGGVHRLQAQDLQFLAVYLLVHGIVKAAIVIALVVGALRVYPWAIAALSALTIYQIVELVLHPSVGLVALTIVDLAVIALTWREWRRHHSLRQTLADTRAWLRRSPA